MGANQRTGLQVGQRTAPRREIELDFLRGLAILAVVDFHDEYTVLLWPLHAMGFPALGGIGVNVFFVLSGFLVGGLLVKEWRVRGGVDAKRFLVRRGFKIWPQYYLFLILNVVSGHRSMRVMWPSFLNVQNYLSPGRGSPHLWSLAVEEHAYLLLVLLLVFAWKMELRMRSVFVLLGVLCLSVIGLRMGLALAHLPIFEPTHTRVAAIFYGVMLAIVFHCAPETFRRVQNWRTVWVGGILIALCFLRFNHGSDWEQAVMIDASDLIGVCAFMLVYRHREGKARSWIYRAVAWVGLYSYGIYLWHVSVASAVYAAGARLPHGWRVAWVAIAEPALGILLGWGMTRLVEFPMLRVRDRWFPRKVESAVRDTPVEASALVNPA